MPARPRPVSHPRYMAVPHSLETAIPPPPSVDKLFLQEFQLQLRETDIPTGLGILFIQAVPVLQHISYPKVWTLFAIYFESNTSIWEDFSKCLNLLSAWCIHHSLSQSSTCSSSLDIANRLAVYLPPPYSASRVQDFPAQKLVSFVLFLKTLFHFL